MKDKLEKETLSKRVIRDGTLDTWREITVLPVRRNQISKAARLLHRTWFRFLNSKSPTIEKLEKRSGMSAGEIMARANSRG